LNVSNNILGVETAYRLDRPLFDANDNVLPDAFPVVQLLYRLGAYRRITNRLGLRYVTGVRVYKELARIVGAEVDSMESGGGKTPVSDSLYSVALGTLELTLYQQMHLFNALYTNDIIESPRSHPSLILDSIELNGNPVEITDTIRRYHPYASIDNIRPTLLGLHKRLVSNPYDRLQEYDIAYEIDRSNPAYWDTVFREDAFPVKTPLSNFAKSGTSDDVIRPFNVDPTSTERTNFGLWNAVIRVDLSAFSGKSTPEIRDITIACIGECNQHYTGARDGKSLHKFISRDLLKKAGIPVERGWYSLYESYIKRVTPDSAQHCADSDYNSAWGETVSE
jgi:hypothetical protein